MVLDLNNIVLSVGAFFAAFYIKQLSESIKEAVTSVKELNSKVAVIIERTEHHSNEITVLRDKQDNIIADLAHLKARTINETFK